MIRRLCLIALLLAFIIGLTIKRYPAIFSNEIAPVKDGEIIELNRS